MNKKEKIYKVCAAYEAAYFRANGKRAEIHTASPGWYHIHTLCPYSSSGKMVAGHHNYRLTDLEILIPRLEKVADNKEDAAKRTGFVVAATPANESPNIGDWFLTEDDKWTGDIENPTVKVYELSSEASNVANMKNHGLPFKYVVIKPFN